MMIESDTVQVESHDDQDLSVDSSTAKEISQTAINLLGYGPKQLKEYLVENGEPGYRARQLIQWVHQRGVTDFEQMSDLPKTLRESWSSRYNFQLPKVRKVSKANDGVVKFALDTQGQLVETVIIPEEKRTTLCISSQAGCALQCAFCETGKAGFSHHLSPDEIIGQVYQSRSWLNENRTSLPKPYRQLAEKSRQIDNIVFMGMGEPLLNADAVLASADLLLSDWAWGLSSRRVTISTAGIIPGIMRMADESDAALAVSLHAPKDELRDWLVPINKKYPIADLLDACRYWLDKKGPSRFITFEYILIDGVNDSKAMAKALVALLGEVRCKVNLIPMNPISQSNLASSDRQQAVAFSRYLNAHGITSTIRKQRGDDINAACGQLSGEIKSKSKRKLQEIQNI